MENEEKKVKDFNEKAGKTERHARQRKQRAEREGKQEVLAKRILGIVKKDEDGYTFSDCDTTFEVGDEVRLNKFYPMKVMEVQENHVIVSRNNWSSSRFAKEYIIPVDRDTRKIHALFFSIKNFIVKKYHENVPPTPGYGIVEYMKIQSDEYDEFLRDNCDDERLVELYIDLACGCSCCF